MTVAIECYHTAVIVLRKIKGIKHFNHCKHVNSASLVSCLLLLRFYTNDLGCDLRLRMLEDSNSLN